MMHWSKKSIAIIFSIVIAIIVVIFFGITVYKNNHKISLIIMPDKLSQIRIYNFETCPNPEEVKPYYLGKDEFEKCIDILDKSCGRELFGPRVIGGDVFRIEFVYEDGSYSCVSIGPRMIICDYYDINSNLIKENGHHYAVNNLNMNLFVHLFHSNNVVEE
ncbi:MAG: hypothetical protein IJM91_01295 [Lachnospiraceae bacterium]|nr:hypothetical protein [Lachnospiraceae bacterium]